MRIISMQKGGDLAAVFNRLAKVCVQPICCVVSSSVFVVVFVVFCFRFVSFLFVYYKCFFYLLVWPLVFSRGSYAQR